MIPTCNEAEVALLGAMIIHEEACNYTLSRLKEEDFSLAKHREIFRAIRMANDEGTVDIVTVKAAMENKHADYNDLAHVVENTPNAEGYVSYCNIIHDTSQKRLLLDFSNRLGLVIREGRPLDEAKELFHDTDKAFIRNGVSRNDMASNSLRNMETIRNVGVDMSWPHRELNNLFGGLRRQYLYTVGAKTSQGKTTFALNVALKALKDGKRVVYNGFENIDQVYPRLAAIEHGIPLTHFLKPNLITEKEYGRARAAIEETHNKYKDRMVILSGASIAQMREYAKESDLIILDYIQRYAHKFNLGSGGLMTHMIGKALSDLQDVAIQSNCACLCLSQFSRRHGSEEARAPQLNDLKESGEIENMSDGVLLLHWRWRDREEGADERDYMVFVDKNKVGPVDTVRLQINPETLAITDWSA